MQAKDQTAGTEPTLRGKLLNTIAKAERKQTVNKEVLTDLASLVDSCVTSYDITNKPDHYTAAKEFVETRLDALISAAIFSRSGGSEAYLQRQQTRHNPSKTWSEASNNTIANTSSSYSEAAKRGAKHPTLDTRNKAFNTETTTPKEPEEDLRLLTRVIKDRLTARPKPLAAKLALVDRLPIEAEEIKSLHHTNTGWSIKLANATTRDLLLQEENKTAIREVLESTEVEVPQTWVTYVVPRVPISVPDHVNKGRTIQITPEMVSIECRVHTGLTPLNVHTSRHGANAETHDITWVISFTREVSKFRLFAESDLCRRMNKPQPITRHADGCQGYHTARHCNRAKLCEECSERVDRHPPRTNSAHKRRSAPTASGPTRLATKTARRNLGGSEDRSSPSALQNLGKSEKLATPSLST